MHNFESRLNEFHELLKEITVTAVEDASMIRGFRAVQVAKESGSPLLAPWMSLILVNSEPVRVTLTTHFKIRDAGVLASEPLGVSPARVLDTDAVDFMKEYSNLAGGRLKKSLQDAQLAAGMSLPLILRGFDYLYMNAADERMRFLREWQVVGPVTLHCAALIDIMSPKTFAEKPLVATSTPRGIVDIL